MKLQDEIVKKSIFAILGFSCLYWVQKIQRASGDHEILVRTEAKVNELAITVNEIIKTTTELSNDRNLTQQDVAYMRSSIADLRNVVIERFPDVIQK